MFSINRHVGNIRYKIAKKFHVGSSSVLTPEARIIARVIDCGYGSPEEFPDEVNGNIALIERGVNTLSEAG